MKEKWQIASWLIVLSFFITAVDSSWAQEPKSKPEKAEAEKANTEKAEAGKAEIEEPALPEDSAVAAILATKPGTPGECIRAAKILSDLKRPDLAKGLLQKVIDAKLDAAALAKLADEFGSAMFIKLSARSELRPESQQLADAVLAAQNTALRNSERIAELIKQLQDPSADNRRAAFSGLMAARGAAVSAMIEVLADATRKAEHPAIRAALAAMGRQAVDPLLAVLDRADPELKTQAIAILSDLKAPVLQLFLFRPYFSRESDAKLRAAAGAALRKLGGAMPTKDQAIRLLTESAKNYLDRRQIIPGVVEGEIEQWRWDETQRKFSGISASADDVARALAARLALDAYNLMMEDQSMVTTVKSDGRDIRRLSSEGEQIRRLYLTTLLEASAYKNGLSNPLDENDKSAIEAAKLGAKAIEGALSYAVLNDHPAAATAAAQILGRIGNAEESLYNGPKPGALALALQNPNRRLRIAAARAIVALKPQRPFAGSSYLVQTLAYFASTSGARKTLLAGANVEDLRKIVPALSAAGLQTDTAANGREVLLLAASSPDYELALIDTGIDQPPINLLLQQLRHENRCADLRVGLIAREGFTDRAERAAGNDPLTRTFPRAHDNASVAWQLEQLSALKPEKFVAFDERQHEAGEALDMLAELGRTSGKLFDIRQAEKAALTALNVPALSRKAIAVLVLVNSPEAQRALVETAGGNAQPLEIRQAAVSAFRENVQAHGILLTAEEIKKRYQRYNESKNRDAATQKILGLILDCLEAPTKTENQQPKTENQQPKTENQQPKTEN
jgi:hypothetical protein